MIRDVVHLHSNNWVPRLEEVKAKTITEILAEAEKYIVSQPGATASIRNNGGIDSGPGGLPINSLTTVGMLPGMPGIDNYCEVPRSLSMPIADGSTVQPTGHFQPPSIKSLSLNQILLPQGSGGFMRNSGALPANGIGCYGDYAVGPGSQVPAPSRMASTVPVAPLIIKKPDALRRKTISLLEGYFCVRLLDEVLQCIKELECYNPIFIVKNSNID
ncbi:eukaryotic translation initiation factor-like isoform X1 [Olea europaea var. sylvestris]|uniref:eukaryotic translation initiation factor-like isoform X1 n=1 Tax=Olea europaea var. sylvestris TaxID=158386 RepID=UPI000C1CF91A|nr:eukaryotic translation initiation factor-like isoform X1 [Olea europaea var. sylvestris]